MEFPQIVRRIQLSFVFIMLGAVLGYLFRRLLATELSVGEYGFFFSVLAFFSFFMLFIDLGLEQAATKKIVEYNLQKDSFSIKKLCTSLFLFQFSLSTLVFILILFLAPYLEDWYFHTGNLSMLFSFLFFLGIWFLTIPFVTFIAYTLLGFQRTTWYTGLDFFRMLFLLFFSGLLFFLGFDVLSALLSYSLVNIALFSGYAYYVYSFFPKITEKISSLFDKPLLMETLQYGILIAFTNFGWILLTQTDTLALTYFTSFHEVGLYNVALPLSLLFLFFVRPFTIVFAPLLTELHATKKQKKISTALEQTFRLLFLFLVPVVFCYLLFPKFIITLLFTEKYIEAAVALRILAFGTLFYAFSLFSNAVFTALGRAKQFAAVVGLVCVLNLMLNILLIPLLGIAGAAYATSCSYLILFFSSLYYLQKYMPFSFPFKAWGAALLFASCSVIVLFVLGDLFSYSIFSAVIPSILLLFILYYGLLFYFKIISWKEIRLFFGMKK